MLWAGWVIFLSACMYLVAERGGEGEVLGISTCIYLANHPAGDATLLGMLLCWGGHLDGDACEDCWGG